MTLSISSPRRHHGPQGRRHALSGTLSPAKTGVVTVFVKKPGSKRWGTIGNVALRRRLASGRPSSRPPSVGKYQFYATFGSTASTVLTVAVK